MFRPSAWVTRGALARPEEFAQECAALGLASANIMLNDYSTARDPVPFEHHPEEDLVAMADAFRSHGIDVTLTTWVMPHAEFIEGMIRDLPGLMAATKATRLDLDAEEPWARANNPLNYTRAARRIAEGMAGYLLGLTGIAWADESDLEPLAEVCPVWLPQCYARPSENSMDPDDAVIRGMSLWRSKFGEFGEPDQWIPGLAGWGLGSDPDRYMRPVVRQCLSMGLSEGCYWTANQLLKDATAGDFVRGARRPAWLPIEDLPSSHARVDVRRLQVMLEDTGHSPGKIDGKPGPNTLAGLESFQRARGLPVTGVADRAVWWELLGD